MSVFRACTLALLSSAALLSSTALMGTAHAAQPDDRNTPLVVASPRPVTQVDVEEVSTQVRYNDLDLNTDKGRARLQLRVAQAATAVCSSWQDLPTKMEGTVQFDRCRDHAIARVNTQLAARMAQTELARR